MRMKTLVKSLLVIGVLTLSACSNSKAEKQAHHEAAKAKPTQTEENVTYPEFKVGDNVGKEIKAMEVKTLKGKKRKLADFLAEGNTIIAFVKSGCVFCESMLAIKGATGVQTKSKFLVVLDSSHADFKGFKEKHEKFKSAGGEWLYDINDDMKTKLGVVSYPRIMLINKAGDLLEHQVGLVMPEDKSSLEGKQFPEILQKLSENTMNWMAKL